MVRARAPSLAEPGSVPSIKVTQTKGTAVNVNSRLKSYFKAGYAGLFLTSYEEQRVEAEIKAIADTIGFKVYVWTITDSLMGPVGAESMAKWNNKDGEPLSPIELLEEMHKVLPEKSIIIAKDYHLFTQDPNPVLIRKMKDSLGLCRNTNKPFVILGCRFALMPELEKEFTVVDFALPDRTQLLEVMQGTAKSAGIELNGNTEPLLDAASGMTTIEAADAASLAFVESGGTKLDHEVVAREKSNVVRKSGILEIIETQEKLEDLGGCENAKGWIMKRRHAFGKEAKAFGLPIPKGILLVGIPGCGKTHMAKIISSVLNVPLLKLDGGKLFGSLVGESERNMRTAIATAEAVAPCVVMVDELEKAFSGTKSSGSTDGGTTSRVFGTFLQWLNDKTKPVFVVATANDVSQLPPEFLRKGRFDELFFVDLPTPAEREAIFAIHIHKRQRDPKNFDLPMLAEATDGFTGAEIEAIVTEGLFAAFDEGTELRDRHLVEAAGATIPLSRTMAAQIEGLRNWSQGRARRASEPKQVRVTSKPAERKMVA